MCDECKDLRTEILLLKQQLLEEETSKRIWMERCENLERERSELNQRLRQRQNLVTKGATL